MENRWERLARTPWFSRRPSRWHVVWLLPLGLALLWEAWSFVPCVAEARADVRAWENRDRGCATDPCPALHRVVDLDVSYGRRHVDEHVTYRDVAGDTREAEIDLGVGQRGRVDWGCVLSAWALLTEWVVRAWWRLWRQGSVAGPVPGSEPEGADGSQAVSPPPAPPS